MSSMTFGQKRFSTKPPDKGSFPIDHDGECKEFKDKFMKCLYNNDMNNTACRLQSKEYLECRMKHNLMKREGWDLLGYKDLDSKQISAEDKS